MNDLSASPLSGSLIPGSLINDGLMVLNPQDPGAKARTIIVTGVARSGTSMVAQALVAAGLFMGRVLDQVVVEDAEMAAAIASVDAAVLDRLVAERNDQAETWGFKRPHLFSNAGPGLAAAFRNPHFIVTYRDPVAVAKRNGISEYFDERTALRDAVADQQRCVEFALGLTCPALLISYEKALQDPSILVDRLLSFCGLAVAADTRERMAATVAGNPQAYVQSARRLFDGYVDQICNGVVTGWCRQVGDNKPVMLEVSVGAHPPETVLANRFRSDLADAGLGEGCHAFALDISARAHFSDEIVTVRVRDRMFELIGSGRTVAQLSS